jgi:hypothetical protein
LRSLGIKKLYQNFDKNFRNSCMILAKKKISSMILPLHNWYIDYDGGNVKVYALYVWLLFLC